MNTMVKEKVELTWALITYLAWEEQKGRCKICGRRIELNATGKDRMIGHHVIPRSRGGQNVEGNCEARHAQPCEVWAHQVDSCGNPSKRKISLYRMYGE